ncbi:MAG: potassium-transporting ATPase subunit KdpB, partial [Candidatus Eremiobacteraeota bacterium]|nr:potassium-transporting ATPase subunit KdpB [Candidatus Eremiobacteraeota bacterium]
MLSQRRLERRPKSRSLWDTAIIGRAIADSFVKLDPRWQARNPVMFIVEVGSVATTFFWLRDLLAHQGNPGFEFAIAVWLWFTVLFANFAEAMAEGRGKAQAEFLRRTKTETTANKVLDGGQIVTVAATMLRKGDLVRVETGELIPSDGDVIQGAATVDESAITGESAPVVRESGGDRSSVTGGTRVLSDWIVVRVSANPGETFLDRMIGLVEGAQRQKTPNEIALSILLAGLTIIFLIAVATLLPYSIYAGARQTVTVLIALLVCLIPTTIGGLLSAIGIAGMDRVMQRNVLAMSGRAVEASGDVDTLLLDKTGTITLGNRQAVEIITAPGIEKKDAYRIAYLSSLPDETPEGRSIVTLADGVIGGNGRVELPQGASFVPFSAYTRMSGVDYCGRPLRKGATEAVCRFVQEHGGHVPPSFQEMSDRISRNGGTPLAVADGDRLLGIIHLKDIVKGGMKERIAQLRLMGIRSIMITGDNPLTAAAIAAEAG